ncbi:MAG: M14 family metallopeptidase [Gemmatimonadota bacterium]
MNAFYRWRSRPILISLPVLLPFLIPPAVGAQQVTVWDLRSLLEPGLFLEDRNGDGHIDHVAGRVVVPSEASAAEVAAAANLAARLSFESYATDLDLLLDAGQAAGGAAPGWPGGPVIWIGDLPEGVGPGMSVDLAPGEGAIQWLHPSSDLPGGGVWINGADATGLLAAADYLSGRHPQVWLTSGSSWKEFAEEVESALGENDTPATLSLERWVVASGRPGVARAEARLAALDSAQAARFRERMVPDSALATLRGLLPEGLQRLDIRLTGPVDEVHRVVREGSWTAESSPRWQPGEVPDFTLSRLYTIQGIFRDTRDDLLPDRLEAYLSLYGVTAAVGAAGPGEGMRAGALAVARSAVDLATRMGLETAGIRFPLARVAGQEDPPEEALGFPILFGVDHPVARRLQEEGKLGLGSEGAGAGTGFVEFIPEAFDERHALAVWGTDEAGLAAAGGFLARRAPFLHLNRKGEYGLEDVEREVRRFFQARSNGGQAALALHKLEQWLDRLEAGERPGVPASDFIGAPGATEGPDVAGGPDGADGEVAPAAPPLAGIHLELALDSVPAGLDGYLEDRLVARFPDAQRRVELQSVGFGAGESILDREMEFPWEVDEARRIFRAQVLPALQRWAGGASPAVPLFLEVRVSEPPEVRRALQAEFAQAVAQTLEGASFPTGAVEVRVLSAYKQGFSWLEDAVLPRLRPQAHEVDRIIIRYRHLQDSDELPWSQLESDTRWIQELFPIDAVLARELEISDSAVVFQAMPADDGGPVYQLQVLDGSGQVILEEGFDPRYVIQPYFHLYPDYEQVRVSTGGIRLVAYDENRSGSRETLMDSGETLVDQRIRTDLELFWDAWQEEVLPSLRDYLMEIHEGAITPGTAPFFDELDIRVRLSEPNQRIGVDEEVISSLESMHNDLYFNTLAFVGHLGQHYNVGSLNHIGRVIPRIDPSGSGQAGYARVRLTGKSKAAPELILRAGDGRWRYGLSPLPTEAPKLRGVALEASEAGEVPGTGEASQARLGELQRLLFDVVARDSLDRFPENRDRASEGGVDRQLLPAPLLQGMVEQVRQLHARGLFTETLAFQGVGELRFRFSVERDEDGWKETATLPRSAAPLSTRNPVLAAEGWQAAADMGQTGEPMVQWDTPIPPVESDSIMAHLGTFPEVETYFVGRSYLGQNLFAADFLPPVEGAFRSQAKLSALRPTLMLSGRQHANEVSSTSHILRLGELLVTDPAYRELLQKVNVVLHPITNADGARLAVELQEENPDFTHHASYLGALGVDVTSGSGDDDPIYPESKVRPALQAMWLPDIFMNLHGYPSHEWVQHFSGYAAWVRGRTVAQRTWWAPRGWFIPGFTYVDDPDHPEIKTAQFAILDSMAAAVTGHPEVEAMSRRQYARYAKYGRQNVDNFSEHFHNGMLTYMSLRGRGAEGSGPTNPKILTFSATTEAPDETARGDWLELVATAGVLHTSALARYLATGVPRVERESEAFDGAVLRRVFRVRPVLPKVPKEESEEGEEDVDR